MISSFVLATRNAPILGGIYRGIYRFAADSAACSLAAIPGVRGVSLHRGMSRPGWEPGVSDIDLLVSCAPGSAEGVGRLWSKKRSLFPMIGDLWLGTEGEIRSYQRWGGLRIEEDLADWTSLAGSGPTAQAGVPSSESGPKRNFLNPWLWCFISHMELSRRYFAAGGEPRGKDRLDSLKLAADVLRFARRAEFPEEGLRLREEFRRRIDSASSGREIWLKSSLCLAECSKRTLSRFKKEGYAEVSLEDQASTHCFPSPIRSAVFNPPYHSYFLLEEDADADAFLAAADGVSVANAPGVPLVLTPSSWALCLQSAYLGAPLGRLGAVRAKKELGLFSAWGARGFGEIGKVPLLPKRLRQEMAAEAASWMALWRRPLWFDQRWSNRFVLFHLHSRSVWLRLALSGFDGIPISNFSALMGAAAEKFPDEAESFESAAAFVEKEPDECVDEFPRERLSAGHEGFLNRQFDALARVLA